MPEQHRVDPASASCVMIARSMQDEPQSPPDESQPLSFRRIDRHFPPAPSVGPSTDRAEMWKTGREWNGYPELEWTGAIFPDRVTAFRAEHKGFYYERIRDFSLVRLLVWLNSELIARGVKSYPSVTLGFEYFDSAYRSVDGRLQLPTDYDPYRGKHNAMLWTLREDDEIAFAGWDPNWGNHGMGYMTREYFDRFVDSAITRWYAFGGPSQACYRCMNRVETHRLQRYERLAHCWAAPNVFQINEETIAGVAHSILYWEVLSLQDENWVDVIEIRDPQQVIGRAHVHHGDAVTTVRELFVLPLARHRGYGTFLERLAVERAEVYEHPTIELWLHDDDARPRTRPAAIAFGEALGYEWREVERHRPNVVAIGGKSLA